MKLGVLNPLGCSASLTSVSCCGLHCGSMGQQLATHELLTIFISSCLNSARDLTDNEELSFYEQCLTNLDVDFHSSSSLPWASLANVGDTIAEFSLNVSIEHLKG